jgi:hypothetical protein
MLFNTEISVGWQGSDELMVIEKPLPTGLLDVSGCGRMFIRLCESSQNLKGVRAS